jgi:hypothetical protein
MKRLGVLYPVEFGIIRDLIGSHRDVDRTSLVG